MLSGFSQVPLFLLEVSQEEALHEGTLMDQLLHSNVFNFLIVVVILAVVFKKFNLLGIIDNQQAKVHREIEAVEAQKQQALSQLKEIQTRQEKLSQEVDSILANARQSAEALSAQIISNAQHEATKLVDASKKRIELEQKMAFRDLESRLLNDAIQQVESTLSQGLSPDDKSRSVDEFLDTLPNLSWQAKIEKS